MNEKISKIKAAVKRVFSNKAVIISAALLCAAIVIVVFVLSMKCITGDHNFEYVNKGATHCLSCKDCGKETEAEPHTLNRFEDCAVCGMKTPFSSSVTYRASADGKYAEAESLVGSPTKIKLSSSFNTLPVKGIKAGAFQKSSLVTVIIPEGIEDIGLSSFEGCFSLKDAVLPDSLKTIGTSAFKNCKALSKIVIPKGVERINNGAFDGCDALTDVYYMGTEAEWKAIYKSIGNDDLSRANIHFNYAY